MGPIEEFIETLDLSGLGEEEDEITIYEEISGLGEEEEVLVFEESEIGAVRFGRGLKVRFGRGLKVRRAKTALKRKARIRTKGKVVRVPKRATVGVPKGTTITVPGKKPVVTQKGIKARVPAGTKIRTRKPRVVRKPPVVKPRVKPPKVKPPVKPPALGVGPAAAGYRWYPERNGWMRPWDPESFILRSLKPEWDQFIPVVKPPVAKRVKIKIPTEGKPIKITKTKRLIVPKGTKIMRKGKVFTVPKRGTLTVPPDTVVQTPIRLPVKPEVVRPPVPKPKVRRWVAPEGTWVKFPTSMTITLHAGAKVKTATGEYTVPRTMKVTVPAGAMVMPKPFKPPIPKPVPMPTPVVEEKKVPGWVWALPLFFMS